MKNIAIVFLFVAGLQIVLPAQVPTDCAQVGEFLTSTEKRIAKFNPHDPELIALHYLFMQDVQKELQQFAEQTISQLATMCPNLPYYNTVSEYDRIAHIGRLKMDSLARVYDRIDSIFYEMAQRTYANKHNDSTFYFLQRALQYNKTNPDVLLMKCQLSFEEKKYSSCLNTLQVLYHDCQLTEEHENSVSDFNMLFYTTLYQNADSLMKIDLASDALLLFKTLETFCTNLPPQYCNDDYYHGILRSKKGVYESYLKIARVAKERGFPDLEMKFLDYAEAYRKENEENLSQVLDDNLAINEETTIYQPSVNIPSSHKVKEETAKPVDSPVVLAENTPPAKVEEVVASVENQVETSSTLAENVPKEKPVIQVQESKPEKIVAETVTRPIEEVKPPQPTVVTKPVVAEPAITNNAKQPEVAVTTPEPKTPIVTMFELEEEPLSPLEIELKEIEYFRLFFEAIDYCLKENIRPAYKSIKKALELEECNCFSKDARVGILYRSLRDILD